jgi:hypothetical protein
MERWWVRRHAAWFYSSAGGTREWHPGCPDLGANLLAGVSSALLLWAWG